MLFAIQNVSSEIRMQNKKHLLLSDLRAAVKPWVLWETRNEQRDRAGGSHLWVRIDNLNPAVYKTHRKPSQRQRFSMHAMQTRSEMYLGSTG